MKMFTRYDLMERMEEGTATYNDIILYFEKFLSRFFLPTKMYLYESSIYTTVVALHEDDDITKEIDVSMRVMDGEFIFEENIYEWYGEETSVDKRYVDGFKVRLRNKSKGHKNFYRFWESFSKNLPSGYFVYY